MRHWESGFPPPRSHCGGRPCAIWIDLFTLCHHPGDAGWVRAAWPDGGALLTQPWPQVAAFRVIADELAAVRAERQRRKGKG